MIKNDIETVRFPAANLCTELTPPEIKKLMVDAVQQGEPDAFRAQIISKLPEQLAKQLAGLGVETPYDLVGVNIKLGNMLYDMYVQATPIPTAPMSQMALRKRVQEQAERLDADQFELTDDVLGCARRTMNDDALWNQLKPSAWIDVGTEKRYLGLNHHGASMFAKTIDRIVQLIEEQDGKKEEKV